MYHLLLCASIHPPIPSLGPHGFTPPPSHELFITADTLNAYSLIRDTTRRLPAENTYLPTYQADCNVRRKTRLEGPLSPLYRSPPRTVAPTDETRLRTYLHQSGEERSSGFSESHWRLYEDRCWRWLPSRVVVERMQLCQREFIDLSNATRTAITYRINIS